MTMLRRRRSGTLALFAGLTFPCLPTLAEAATPVTQEPAPSWTRWGGPRGDFQVPGARLASRWPATGPALLWRRDLGEGYSALVGAEGLLYTLYRDGTDEVIRALSAVDGRTAWEHRYPAPPYAEQTGAYGQGPNAPPLLQDGRLYTVGFTGLLHCLDARTGEPRWSRDLVADWGARVQFYGHAGAPTFYRDQILVLVGGEECGVVAVAPDTGEVRWRSPPCEVSYAPPTLIRVDGQDQFVFFSPTEVLGMDPTDGSFLWRHPVANLCKTNCTAAVAGDDDLLWVATKGVGGTRVLRLSRPGGSTVVEEVWRDRRVRVYQWNAIRVGDVVYTTNGEGRSAYSAIDVRTGEIRASLPGHHAANSIFADGKLIVLDDAGRLSLLAPTDDAFEVLAGATVSDGVTWTPPTLIGSVLYVRDRRTVQAFDLGGGEDRTDDAAPAAITAEARRILERADQVTGAAAMHRLQNRVAKGRVRFPDVGLEGRTLEITARPDLRWFRTECDWMDTVVMGSDGDQVWTLVGDAGALVETGEAREAALDELAFDGPLAWRERYGEARVEGAAEVDGVACDRLLLAPRIGQPEERLYARDTGLLRQRKLVRLSANGGETPMTFTYSDHRPVDGVLIPHTTHLRMVRCGTEHERWFFLDEVRHDVELAADTFEIPAAVQEVLRTGAGACGTAGPPCAPKGDQDSG